MLHKIKRKVTQDDSALVPQSIYAKLEPDAGFDIEIRNLRHAAQLRQKDRTIETLHGNIKTANGKLEKAEEKSATLNNINQGLNLKCKEALDLLYELQQQFGEVERSKKILEGKLDESRSNNQSLRKVHSSQIKLLNKRHHITQNRIKDLEVELKSIKIRYEELEKDLYRSELSIKSLNDNFEKLKTENTLLSAGILQDFEENITLKKEKTEMESHLKRIRTERDELRNQVQILNRNQTEDRIKALKGQVDHSKKNLNEVQEEQNRLRIQLETSIQAQKEAKIQCEKLQNQLNQAKAKHDGLESELAKKIECIEKIEAQVIEHRSLFKEVKEENGRLHALRKRAAEVEEDYNELFRGRKKRKIEAGMTE